MRRSVTLERSIGTTTPRGAGSTGNARRALIVACRRGLWETGPAARHAGRSVVR